MVVIVINIIVLAEASSDSRVLMRLIPFDLYNSSCRSAGVRRLRVREAKMTCPGQGAQVVGHHLEHQKVVGLLPRLGCKWEATVRCFSLSFLFPFSL